jgi:prolyl 4-hydroxylase
MKIHEPLTSSGTATFPSHRFIFAPEDDPDDVHKTFVVGNYPENLFVYDPFWVEGDPAATEANLAGQLTPAQRVEYDSWRRTIAFDKQYKAATGRSYLANYLRSPPSHFMWRADSFGDAHWVETRETHFVSTPPDEELEPILQKNRKLSDPVLLQHREPGVFNMTMKVISCAPRAFEITNFLSQTEVNHILKISAGIDLQLSSTGDTDSAEERKKEDSRRTRTSFNSWLPREKSPIIDAIYRRAADLMRIDEALMRYRTLDEYPDLGTKKSIAESLQLVHYGLTQEYTAHHDFGFSRIGNKAQGARFATLLLYLNEGMSGGETSFPRWVNAETFHELKVTPTVGKAVLFYSQLPGM